jgi:hypothetical protein
MQAFELADLAINTQLRLDGSWLLFLTINSTIIGAIILIERTFSVLEKSVATVIYLVVVALNYMTTTNSIRLLGSIYNDLGKFDLAPSEPGYEVIQQIGEIYNSSILWDHPQWISVIYIGGIALSVTAIIFDEKLTRTKLEANTSAGV